MLANAQIDFAVRIVRCDQYVLSLMIQCKRCIYQWQERIKILSCQWMTQAYSDRKERERKIDKERERERERERESGENENFFQ